MAFSLHAKIEDQPNIDTVNIARSYDSLRADSWSDRKFQQWTEGRTGYPMVDACMRALAGTGYLNFRMRAMVMSFASYHLWLDWRETGLYLAPVFGLRTRNSLESGADAKWHDRDQQRAGVFTRQASAGSRPRGSVYQAMGARAAARAGSLFG